MKKILVTGGTGFVGRNILPILINSEKYKIYAPNREELNIKDEHSVCTYLKNNEIDIVVHLANPNPKKNKLDKSDEFFEDSVRIFLNFYNHSDLFEKMIYAGSGAEYDKSLDIDLIDEKQCFRSIPQDAYGLAKVIMNKMAQHNNKIFNFRIMGCYGPSDHESKFITHCIRSVIRGAPITIRKNCKFDYMHVYDFAKYIMWGIDSDLEEYNYNVSSGQEEWLSDIANKVVFYMSKSEEYTLNKAFEPVDVQLLSKELNKNYTASNKRIVDESGIEPSISLDEGIKMQIQWELENWSEDTKFDE